MSDRTPALVLTTGLRIGDRFILFLGLFIVNLF